MSEPGLEPKLLRKRTLAHALLRVVGLAAVTSGCASQAGMTELGDGSYRVECDRPLLACLEPAAKACELHGYEIYEASEARDSVASSPSQAYVLKSHALVRCRKPKPYFLIGGGKSLPSTPPPASSSAPCPPPASAPPAPAAPAPPALAPAPAPPAAAPAPAPAP